MAASGDDFDSACDYAAKSPRAGTTSSSTQVGGSFKKASLSVL